MHPTRQYGDTSEGRGVPASWLVHFSARAVFTEHVRRKAVSASGRKKKKRSVAATRGVRSDLPWIDYRLWLVWSADANWRPCCKTENVAPAGCWRWNKHKTAAHARSQYWRVHLIMFFNEIDVRKALVTDKTCMFTVDKGKQNSRDMLTNTTA